MKTLLVPTDFSREAQAGLEYAAALSLTINARIILLHAFQLGVTDLLYTQIVPATRSFKESARDQLQLAGNVINNMTNQVPHCIVEEGTLGDAIAKTRREHKIDYIVMGTHGAKGLRKIITGSHTSRIIHNASCPVLSIPQETKFHGLKKISFATRYTRSDITELRALAEFARPFNAEIEVFHLFDINEDRIEQIMQTFGNTTRKQITYNKLKFQALQGTSVHSSMQNYLETEKPDLLAVSTRKRQFLERLAEPGLSDRISFECQVPLLVFHQLPDPFIL